MKNKKFLYVIISFLVVLVTIFIIEFNTDKVEKRHETLQIGDATCNSWSNWYPFSSGTGLMPSCPGAYSQSAAEHDGADWYRTCNSVPSSTCLELNISSNGICYDVKEYSRTCQDTVSNVNGSSIIAIAADVWTVTGTYRATSSNGNVSVNWSTTESGQTCPKGSDCTITFTHNGDTSRVSQRTETVTATDSSNNSVDYQVSVYSYCAWDGITGKFGPYTSPKSYTRDTRKHSVGCDAYEGGYQEGGMWYYTNYYYRCCGSSTPDNPEVTKEPAEITCQNKIYSGDPQTIATCSGGTIANASQTNGGEYTVTCTGDANHTDAESKVCKIEPQELVVTCNTPTPVYNENPQVIASCGEGGHLHVSSKTFTDAGEHIVTCWPDSDMAGNYSASSKECSILKANPVCPSVTDYSGYVDGSSYTIGVNGGSGGTIMYRTSLQDNWSTTKPTRTEEGTTTVYVKVKGNDNYNDNENCSSASITLTSKGNATCPTLTDYTGDVDGSSHTIGVSGGSGGTIMYRTSEQDNWSTTKPTRTEEGTTTVYVKVAGDATHNDVTCGSRTITLTKLITDATCPTLTDYSGYVDGSSHTIGVSGGSGGTIMYRTSLQGNWSTTKPTRTEEGTTTVYVMVAGDSTHNDVTCGNRTITLTKLITDATCPTTSSYEGVYDGLNHSIPVGTSPNGTVEYRTSLSESWSIEKPQRKDVGVTTVYIRVRGDDSHNDVLCDTQQIKINEAASICPTVSNYNGIVDDDFHTIGVSGGSGGTIMYRTLESENWSLEKPQRKDVGTTTVYVKVIGDSNHSDNDNCPSAKITLIEKPSATCPTTSSYIGNYDGNSHTITVTGGSGGSIEYRDNESGEWTSSLPTRKDVGTTTVYIRVLGDSTHNTVNCNESSIIINEIPATCPTVRGYSGVVDGNPHSIETTGGSNGIIEYREGTTGNWSTIKPTLTTEGTMVVYVRVTGNNNYSDVECESATVVLSNPASPNATCPSVTSFTGKYDGNDHTIEVTGGFGGTIEYRTSQTSNWESSLPTRKDVGTTTVYIRVLGDSTHETVDCGYSTININRADSVCPTLVGYSGLVDGNNHTIEISEYSGGTVEYRTSMSESWSEEKPTRKEIGTTRVYVQIQGDSNHNSKDCGMATITLSDKPNATCPTIDGYIGMVDGENHSISVTGSSGGTIMYRTNSNDNWSTTKPNRKDAGTTTVYIKVEGDNSHNSVNCGTAQIILSEKPLAICPITQNYSGIYDGNPHSIEVAGSEGGIVEYRENSDDEWSTIVPTRIEVGTTNVYIRVNADENHTSRNCESAKITINAKEVIKSCYMKKDDENGNSYCFDSESNCQGFDIKLDYITLEEACNEQDACYVNSNNVQIWGKYQNNSNYTKIDDITTKAQCIEVISNVPKTYSGINRIIYFIVSLFVISGMGIIIYVQVKGKN